MLNLFRGWSMGGGILGIGLALGIAATVVICILVLPKSKDGKLSKFGQFLHNIFNFKQLFLETVLKFAYVLLTICSITIGFCSLFGGSKASFLTGLLYMLVMPVVIRLVFEGIMLLLLLVTNVIAIRNKVCGTNESINMLKPEAFEEKARERAGAVMGMQRSAAPAPQPAAPAPQPAAPAPQPAPMQPVQNNSFTGSQDNLQNQAGGSAPATDEACPGCGKMIPVGSKFCIFCGKKL